MLTLDQIGLRAGTDKSSAVHNFLVFYEKLLNRYKDESFLLIEIGVYMGHSLSTWSEFFPNATHVGVDIDPEALKVRTAPNASVVLGDASRLETLDAIAETHGAPLIVVEDGSHRWHHQIETLRYLWPRIKPGGVFIMEDIHTSFPDAEDEYRGASEVSCYDYLLELNRWIVGNRYMSKQTPKDGFVSNYWPTMDSMHFYRGTCLIFKK